MSYKREQIIKKIADNLAFSSKSTALENVIGLFDSNRIAQDFFSELFKLVFGYAHLEDLDKLNGITNYPAIDLGDKVSRIAFQITTKRDSEKIKDTIKRFLEHKLYDEYDRLVVFIIGEKQTSYTNFDTKSKFNFSKEKDIWDDHFLISEIDKLDIEKLSLIQNFLEENLVELKFPERLFPKDIKMCIEILKRDFGSSSKLQKQLTVKRQDEFIRAKNSVNNMSWDFFKEKIRGHLQYNKTVFEFLSDPINETAQVDYIGVSEAIQGFYKDPQNSFTSFEKVFNAIFNKLNTYNDNIPGLNTKLKILLHNMYFNCDIGDNPDENA